MAQQEIKQHLDEARYYMDGVLDTTEPDVWDAFDQLEKATRAIADRIEEIEKGLYRMANEVSCRANGIIPD